MNSLKPPLIREHSCSEREVAARIMDELGRSGFASAGGDPLKDALVSVFARYCEILIERLNRVPESHYQAFVSMLGATPVPAVPARVALTFKAIESAQSFAAIVPKSTQVSAPAENASGLVLFETSKDLLLVQAELLRAVAVDMQRLVYADVNCMVSPASPTGFAPTSLFVNAIPIERALHIGQPTIIGLPGLTQLRLKIDLDYAGELSPDTEIEWGIQSETGFFLLKPELDTTGGLTRSGELVFAPPEKWPGRTIGIQTLPWLTCRLRQCDTSQFAVNPAKTHLMSIARIELAGYASVTATPIEKAFHGGIPLDVSRDFYPLGERPRFGDVFYAFSESFAAGGTQVELVIKLTNPAGAPGSPIPVVSNKGNPQLRWECHTARGWAPLDCVDDTRALTQDGTLNFSVPGDATPAIINGAKGGCIRARVAGGYYTTEDHPAKNEPASPMAPPSIAEIKLTSNKEFGPAAPGYLMIESNFEYKKVDVAPMLPFVPFPPPKEQGVVLYLGVKIPGTKTSEAGLAGRTISFYAVPCNDNRRRFIRETRMLPVAAFRWQARGTTGWIECDVNDLTQGCRNPGIIEVRVPTGISLWNNSTLDHKFFWLRIVWDAPEADKSPCLRRLLLNTVLASQTIRLENQLLGSSNGRPKQIFRTLHNPIIGEVMLEVREPGRQAEKQPGIWRDEDSQYSLGSMKISTLPLSETWVSWSEVEEFSGSGSQSRHYIVDRLKGSIRFGDGSNGRIPPSGANNIRLREYHAGGGSQGNRPAGTISRLHTTIPYIESVTNHEPATGGQDTEDLNSRGQGAAAHLRHRDRAVCIDDYADLARKASPQVAYAKCIAAQDVVCDPLGRKIKPGVVSVIIVPYGNCKESRPQPSFELVKNVKTFLDARRPTGVDLVIAGPEYVAINVLLEISWKADRSTAEAVIECEKRLTDFLHPITGGANGEGWRLGQLPHASDIYPLLGTIEGLDYILKLELRSNEERPGLLSVETFLICSGKHEIRLC